MARRLIRMPAEEELGPGPLRDLLLQVHRLYREAGYPGSRQITARMRADDACEGTMSHETVCKFLAGATLPGALPVRALARALAGWTGDAGADRVQEEVLRVAALWPAAREAQAGTPPGTPGTPAVPAAPPPPAGLAEPAADAASAPTVAEPPVPGQRPVAGRPGDDLTGAGMRSAVGAITRALVGHGDVALVDVEDSARELRGLLLAEFERQIESVNAALPPGMALRAAAAELRPPQASGGYRYLADGQFALQVELEVAQPVELRAQCTPIIGIAADRHSRRTFQIMDANKPPRAAADLPAFGDPPGGRPVWLEIGEVRPRLTQRAEEELARWVDGQLRGLLAVVEPALKKRFS